MPIISLPKKGKIEDNKISVGTKVVEAPFFLSPFVKKYMPGFREEIHQAITDGISPSSVDLNNKFQQKVTSARLDIDSLSGNEFDYNIRIYETIEHISNILVDPSMYSEQIIKGEERYLVEKEEEKDLEERRGLLVYMNSSFKERMANGIEY